MIVRRMVPSEGSWLSSYDDFDQMRRQIQGLVGEMEQLSPLDLAPEFFQR